MMIEKGLGLNYMRSEARTRMMKAMCAARSCKLIYTVAVLYRENDRTRFVTMCPRLGLSYRESVEAGESDTRLVCCIGL